jgi:Fe-S cluster assembly ATPase SufC
MGQIPILEIKDLHATVDGKEILKGLTLTINPFNTRSKFPA